jgi:drug/metabolite transporter (DMT)-like permease
MLAGAAVLVVFGLIHGEAAQFRIDAIAPDSLVALVYLTAIGSLLAFTTYGWLLRVAPLPLVATYAYVNPVVAVILGALVLAEPIEPRTLVAGAVIVTAVALIVTTRGRMRTPAPRRAAPRFAASVSDPSS